MNFYFLLGIITTLLFNLVQATKENGEKFYVILVEHESKDGKGHVKREDKEEFLDAIVSEINHLIIGNKETYENQSMLEELEEASSSIRKRNEEENKFAYIISSLESQSVIYSYLSEDLVPLVKNLPNVKACLPDIKFESHGLNNGDFDDLRALEFTKWKNTCVKGNTFNYLSLISQGYHEDYMDDVKYDNNYYFPSSAGEGISIFFVDGGFNFNHPEYSNKDEREVKCVIYVNEKNKYKKVKDPKICMHDHSNYHGSQTTDVAGGITQGVASKANIYGIEIPLDEDASFTYSALLAALQYISDNYLDKDTAKHPEKYRYKTVINLSLGCRKHLNNVQEVEYFIGHLKKLTKQMTEMGAVIVVSAGNTYELSDDLYYPCSDENVICVGAVDNIGINELDYMRNKLKNYKQNEENFSSRDELEKAYQDAENAYNNYLIDQNNYRGMATKNYRIAHFSNFGEYVDIYAPGFVGVKYNHLKEGDSSGPASGTSFSAPIVAGVAATIMSEFPEKKFNSTEMLKYLKDKALKEIIKDVPTKDDATNARYPELFINNGKRILFNKNSKYDTCGNTMDCPFRGELSCYNNGCCLNN